MQVAAGGVGGGGSSTATAVAVAITTKNNSGIAAMLEPLFLAHGPARVSLGQESAQCTAVNLTLGRSRAALVREAHPLGHTIHVVFRKS